MAKANQMAHGINTVYFPVMKAGEYTTANNYYTKGKAGLETARFWEYFANSVAKYMSSGRVEPLNNLLTAAYASGNYRSFVRVAKALCAHDWTPEKRAFEGKADKKKLKSLRKVNIETGAEKWEQTLYDHMVKEFEFKQQQPAKAWDEMGKAVAFLVDMVKHDVKNESHIKELIHTAFSDDKVKAAIEAKSA